MLYTHTYNIGTTCIYVFLNFFKYYYDGKQELNFYLMVNN